MEVYHCDECGSELGGEWYELENSLFPQVTCLCSEQCVIDRMKKRLRMKEEKESHGPGKVLI